MRPLWKACGFIAIEDPPNILAYRLKDCKARITWVDLRNYGMDCPVGTANGSRVCNWLYRWWIDYAALIRQANLGGPQTTAAAQAFHGFRCNYYSGGIYCHDYERANRIENQGYYGGRSEAYLIGTAQRNCWHLDYRSLYPAICTDTRTPVRLVRILDNPSESHAAYYCSAQCAIAEVTIRTEEPAYPYRRQINSSVADAKSGCCDTLPDNSYGTDVIYPVGTFRTTLCGPELYDAFAHNRILVCHSLAIYEVDYALKTFAECLYAIREEEDDGCTSLVGSVVKRILVSIAGKLGQRDRRWTPCSDEWGDIRYGEWWGSDAHKNPCRYRAIAGHVFREEIGGFSFNAVPATAAWICSEGRMRLLRAIRIAGWKEVYYCDTDSIVCSERGYDNLISADLVAPRTLGKLYLKCGPVRFEARGIKYYLEDGNITCAGLPKGYTCSDGDTAHYWHEQRLPGRAAREKCRNRNVH